MHFAVMVYSVNTASWSHSNNYWLCHLLISNWCNWGFQLSGMWCCVFGWIVPFSKEHTVFILEDQVDQEEFLTCDSEGDMFLWDIKCHSRRDVASHPRRPESSIALLWIAQNSNSWYFCFIASSVSLYEAESCWEADTWAACAVSFCWGHRR